MPFDPKQPRDAQGRWTKKAAGGLVGTTLLAGLMASAGGGGTTESVGATLDTAAGQRGTLVKSTRSSRNAAKKGNEREAWDRMALKKVRNEVKRDLECAAQSYGEVQDFFLHHPCRKLQQRLFPLADDDGNVITVSVMWVTMPSRSDATKLKRVEDRYGTGDVTPVGTQLLGFGDFRFTGQHYESRQAGSQLVITETEALQGHPSGSVLDDVASIANLLPPP